MKLEQRLINLIEGQLEGLSRSQQMGAYRSIGAFCSVRVEKMLNENLALNCVHKFVDSNRCLKCGWTPTPA